MNIEIQIMIFTAVLSAVTSSGFTSLIIYLLQRHDKKKEKERENQSAQSKMLLGLGHDKIMYLTEKYVQRGAITLKEKRNLQFLYDPYIEMGGNGDCRIGYEACQKLEVISDEESNKRDASLKRKEFKIVS